MTYAGGLSRTAPGDAPPLSPAPLPPLVVAASLLYGILCRPATVAAAPGMRAKLSVVCCNRAVVRACVMTAGRPRLYNFREARTVRGQDLAGRSKV